MAAVAEDLRMAELRRLGASEPLVRLASGDCVHAAFRDCCLGPPHYTYNGAPPPSGPPFVPLWDHCDTVVGVWRRQDGPEFIEYDIEADYPDEYEPLARTEQGFWATRFDFLYQCDVPLEELREAAVAVGFRFLDRQLEWLAAASDRLATFDGHAGWLQELVAGIDQEAARAVPGTCPGGDSAAL